MGVKFMPEEEALSEYVFPYKIEDKGDQGKKCEKDTAKYLLGRVKKVWWLNRYKELLPNLFIGDNPPDVGSDLVDYIEHTTEHSVIEREAIVNHPDYGLGTELAKLVLLNSCELGLILLSLGECFGGFSLSWWKPKEIVEHQRKLEIPERDILNARRLARSWWSEQKILRVGLVSKEGSVLIVAS